MGKRLEANSIAETLNGWRPLWGWSRRMLRVSVAFDEDRGSRDLLALNIDLASVMQAGRWKSNRIPMRYGEHVLAVRGSMARAAKAQGRERI